MSFDNFNPNKERRVTMITPNFGADPTTAASREVPDPITELLRVHARDLIAAALEAEVQSVLQQLRADGAQRLPARAQGHDGRR
jgi:hypothetical protein